MLIDQLFQNSVGLIVDQEPAGLDLIQKDAELLEVIVPGREDIYMVPGNAGENGDMREKKMELWPLFQDTGRIFIALADDERRAGDIDRLGKPPTK
jgi:hypothetical protein